jgi:hypothetical protein
MLFRWIESPPESGLSKLPAKYHSSALNSTVPNSHLQLLNAETLKSNPQFILSDKRRPFRPQSRFSLNQTHRPKVSAIYRSIDAQDRNGRCLNSGAWRCVFRSGILLPRNCPILSWSASTRIWRSSSKHKSAKLNSPIQPHRRTSHRTNALNRPPPHLTRCHTRYVPKTAQASNRSLSSRGRYGCRHIIFKTRTNMEEKYASLMKTLCSKL